MLCIKLNWGYKIDPAYKIDFKLAKENKDTL
jgi:hypothetical protein